MQISRITDIASFNADEWNDLVERSVTATIYLTYEWLQTWWQLYGKGLEPLILEARLASGELVGIAPLLIETKSTLGQQIRDVRFIGVPYSNYSDFIIADPYEDVLSAFIDWIAEHQELWSVLQFSRILNSSPTYEVLPRLLAAKGYKIIGRENLESPLYEFNIDPKADKRLPKKQGMQNKLNRLKREGNVTFSMLSDAQEILDILPMFYEQHIRRRQSATSDSPSQFLDELQRQFLEGYIQALAPKGKIRVDILWINDQPLAFNFFLVDVDPKRHILSLLSFELEYSKFSPGLLLLKYSLEASMQQAIREFDFSVGEYGYKYRFSNKIRTINSIFAANNAIYFLSIRIQWIIKDYSQQLRRKYPRTAFKIKRWKNILRNPSAFDKVWQDDAKDDSD